MARRRTRKIPGLEDWQVQFLQTGEVPTDAEVAAQDLNPFEVIDWHCHGAQRTDPVVAAWQTCRNEILPWWIARYPGSRPYGWWAADSGLERKRGMQLTPKTYGKNVLCSLRDSIPKDQRAWLAEHGHLLPGE